MISTSHLRYALRTLRRTPGFTIAFIITLGMGIGANTAIFSVVNGVLLKPLPHRDGDQLVYLRQSAQLAGIENTWFSVPEINDFREGTRSFSGIAEFSALTFTMLGSDEPRRVQSGIVTGNYFDVMGLDPVLGRVFNTGDDGEAAAPVMVLTYEFWKQTFGGDSSVIGQTVRMNGRTLEIVGVLQPVPQYPAETDVLVNMVTSPHHLSATMVVDRTHRMTEIFGRLAPGATLEGARAEINGIAASLHSQFPEAYEAAAGYTLHLTTLQEALTTRARTTFLILLATAAFVLVIACANVANLTLTRNTIRQRELTVRAALGAGHRNLRSLLLAEHLILSLAGGALGLALAYAGIGLLVNFAAGFTPRATEIALEGRVLAFALTVSLGIAVILAWIPRLPEIGSLGSTVHGGTRQTGGLSHSRMHQTLIVTQLAVSFVLLVGAGLLLRTVYNLYRVDPGLEIANVITMETPAVQGSRSIEEVYAHNQEMLRRIGAIPGVQHVALGSNPPLESSPFVLEMAVEGRPVEPGRLTPRGEYRTATPDYFLASGIPLLAGRPFADTDHADAAKVVIINETLSKTLFPDRDPIGQRVAWTGEVLKFVGIDGGWRTVVGVVADTRDKGLDAAPPAVVFQPYAQELFAGHVVIRSAIDPSPIINAATQVVRSLDPNQPVDNVRTLVEIRDNSVATRRLNATLIAIFAALAMAIAAVGVTGVLAFSVSQRTNEIGIRMSLGATAARVRTMVLREGTGLLIVGLAVGTVTTLVVGRLLSGMLFEVTPFDPFTLGVVATLLSTVTVVASWLPARRASRVEPVQALKAQ